MTADRLELVTRRNCPLCQGARSALIELAARRNLGFSEFDVDEDRALLGRFSDRVPVILYRGQVVAEGRISPDGLRQAVDELRGAI